MSIASSPASACASSPASACTLPLAAHFSLLQDPRVDRTKQHLLLDIVVIAFCAVLCGAEGWEDMEEFGRAKHAWLKERLELPLPNGIPTDDTFRRLFARLDPEQFGRCFLNFAHSLHTYTNSLHTCTKGEVIALDGKAVRHSFDDILQQRLRGERLQIGVRHICDQKLHAFFLRGRHGLQGSLDLGVVTACLGQSQGGRYRQLLGGIRGLESGEHEQYPNQRRGNFHASILPL